MPDEPNYKTKNYVLFILGVIGYIAVIMAPAILLALRFPKYGLFYIIIGAMLCFAVPGFKLGLYWAARSSNEKKVIKQYGIDIFSLVLILSTINEFSVHKGYFVSLLHSFLVISILIISNLLHSIWDVMLLDNEVLKDNNQKWCFAIQKPVSYNNILIK